MDEPSVLDYVISRLFFWRKERILIPPGNDYPPSSDDDGERLIYTTPVEKPPHLDFQPDSPPRRWFLFPPGSGWTIARLLVTLIFVLLAQSALEPPSRSLTTGVVLYLIAITWLLWSNHHGEWGLPAQPDVEKKSPTFSFRKVGLWFCIPLGFVAFLMFGDNLFTPTNLFVWALAFTTFVVAFWLPGQREASWIEKIRTAWFGFKSHGVTFSPWTLLVLAVFGFSAFFRFYLLDQVPAEMFSDHAEKLLDVRNILNGQTSIYFPRNTGREAIQMYLTAMMALVFNTGFSFLSLKLGTAFCGLFTLPFIYLIGKEIANRRTGLLAMFFAGIAYWPNVISRVALRFTLYPTFTAPMLYFLLRGLRRRNRNDFILSGVFLGLGLHGYSPYRFVPIVVVVIGVLYLLHGQSKGDRKSAVWGLLVLAYSSFIIFLPLLRYMISNQAAFSYRMMTRMGQVEKAFIEPPLQIFIKNFWKASTMLVWDNGQIWVHSIPFRPALGIVTAAFTILGVVLLVVRYIKEKNWLDITLLVSIPLLMMPSVLSLAFPEENPSLNRTGGALVVVFLIAGMAFDSMLTAFKSDRLSPGGKWLAWAMGIVLLSWSASQNYELVFNQYAQQFRTNAWNTSELGAVIQQFADSSGAEDSAWVIPYPHWVDTRLVGIRAGYPERDYALWPENIIDTLDDPRAKLYLVKPEDTETINLLKMYYPTGVLRLYESQVAGRDFYMYSVPPKE
jgi:4-amino-4-deoxy-L-arabinose transferase-like glycosyltransferase